MIHRLLFDTTDANTRAASAQVGAVLYDAANDRLGVINASNELQVRDDDANTTLASILADSTSIDGTLTALSKAEDAAHSSGDQGIQALAVRNDTEGSLVDTDGDYAPLQVDSLGRLRVIADLDVANLSEKAEDAAHSSGDIGDFVLAVRQDTLASSTSADGDYAAFKVNAAGELYVVDSGANALLTTIDADTSAIAVDIAAIETELLDQGTTLDSILTDTNALVVDLAAIEVELLDQGTTLDTIAGDTTSIDAAITALSKAEDSAHSSGDQGIQALAVRNDTLGSLVDTDGDYAPLQVNSSGELYVTIGNEIDVNDTANTAISAVAETVGTVVGQIIDGADELANRKYVFLYNNGNREMFIGQTGITTGTGFPLPPGSILEMRLGSAVDLFAIADAAAQDLRTLQLS